MCLCGPGCLGLKEGFAAVPSPPLLSQVTVGGPSWPALGRLDPYGTGGGGGGGEGTWLILKSIAFLFSFFFKVFHWLNTKPLSVV